MAIFPNKKTPIDAVLSMRAKGLSNTQIIQTLQRDGYSYGDILNALDQADQPTGAPIMAPQDPMNQGFMPAAMNIPQPVQVAPQQDLSSSEDLIEAIIDEKWNELVKDIEKIVDWKNKTENRITGLQQEFADLKSNFDKVHQAVIGKIGEYDKNILEIGSDIKAMEKAFSKVLPVFTDNVNELSRVVDKVKRKKK
ncbi:hypothetical protein C4573_04290 [Candidatus Woesearchaeota archaeon]|nr:MAG: hypothetical protein C4573_04290 [Candidatus Woesearchaeota archaeon]